MRNRFFSNWLVALSALCLSLSAMNTNADQTIQAFAVSGTTLFELDIALQSSETARILPATTTVIATNPVDEKIYAYGGLTFRYLYTWDPETDAVTQIRSYTGTQRLDATRMGFSNDGTLYLSDAQERLYTLDTNTGTVTLLGSMTGLADGPYGATGDLAFSPDGTLYIANYRSLYTLDLSTLAATELYSNMIPSPSPVDVSVWSGLAFCDGQLHAASAEIRTGQAGIVSGVYNIDLLSGLDTHLYDAPDQVSDLAACREVVTGGTNTTPVAEYQALSTEVDFPLSIVLQGQDADNDPLTYFIQSQPVNGTLAGSGNGYTYTPAPGYSGSDSFTFIVNDGQIDSVAATIDIQVGGPAASDIIIYGANAYGRDQMVELNLTQQTPQVVANLPFGTQAMAQDPETGYVYFYEWLAAASRFAYWNPADNSVTIVRTYSPINGFYAKRMDFAPDGTLYLSDDQEGLYTIDKITGDVNFLGTVTGLEDGIWEATGDMTFTPDGTLWVSNYRTMSTVNLLTLEATAVFTNLIGTAALEPYEDAVLTGIAYCDGSFYTTSAERATGQSAVFRVDPNTGAETFLFYAGVILNDITSCSVASFPSNSAPVANDQNLSTTQGQPVSVVLQASDADGDSLAFSIYNSPANGTLTGNGSSYTYTPNPGFFGDDSFEYQANDGVSVSNIATVSVAVEQVIENSAPVAFPQSLSATSGVALPVTLLGSDVDGDGLSFSVITQPLNGILSGSGDSYTYFPAQSFEGTDTIQFIVNDGELDSAPATITILVSAETTENLPPVAFSEEVAAFQEQAVDIVLEATDPEDDALTYIVISQPSSGTLTGSNADLTYLPSPGFSGTDSFTFIANDGDLDSDFAVVTINVDPVISPPQGIFSSNSAGTVYGLDMALLSATNEGTLPFGSSAIALQQTTGRLYFYGGNALRFLAYRDPVTGALTQVKSYSGPDILDAVRMDFAPDGTLYMTDTQERLYTIDSSTGDVTLLGTITGLGTGPFGATGDMLFADDGTLWMASYRSLYTINLNTLEATEVYSDMITTSGPGDTALWSGLAMCNGQVYGSSAEIRGGQTPVVSGLFSIDLSSGSETFLFDAPAQINDLSSCN